MNRTIQERLQCMHSNASFLGGFWAEAMKIAVHVINRSPSKSLDGGIPKEAWTSKKPSYSHLHTFGGCEANAMCQKSFERS